MPELNDIEVKFLELMQQNYKFKDNDSETIHLVGTHATNGVLDTVVYQYGNCILSIKKGKYSSISIIINNIQYALEEFELDDGLTKTVISAGTYQGEKRISIEITPDSQMKNYAYLTTTITGTKAKCGVSIIHCSVVEIADYATVLKLDASTYNYLLALEETINNIDDSRSEIKDFFMKMRSLYQLLYEELGVIPVRFKDNYLRMLARKTRYIKDNAKGEQEYSNQRRVKDMLQLQSIVEENKYTKKLQKITDADSLRRKKIQIVEETALREIAWERKCLDSYIEDYVAKHPLYEHPREV